MRFLRLFAEGCPEPRAACRLLLPIATREHNRRIARTPRTPRVVAHTCSSPDSPSRRSRNRYAGGSAIKARPTEVSWPRGRPAGAGFDTSRRDRSTTKALPQPNRLEHLLSRPALSQAGRLAPRSALRTHAVRRTSTCLRRARLQGRLTRSPAKGSTIRRTRGVFHRRTAPSGAERFSPACPQAVDGR